MNTVSLHTSILSFYWHCRWQLHQMQNWTPLCRWRREEAPACSSWWQDKIRKHRRSYLASTKTYVKYIINEYLISQSQSVSILPWRLNSPADSVSAAGFGANTSSPVNYILKPDEQENAHRGHEGFHILSPVKVMQWNVPLFLLVIQLTDNRLFGHCGEVEVKPLSPSCLCLRSCWWTSGRSVYILNTCPVSDNRNHSHYVGWEKTGKQHIPPCFYLCWTHPGTSVCLETIIFNSLQKILLKVVYKLEQAQKIRFPLVGAVLSHVYQ